jgi:DNA polymerase IV
MDLPINKNKPLTMHVDLNSAYATIEQQANPLLRGKPLVVAAYSTPSACIVAPSIEAKRFGIKTGMRIREARLLNPHIIVRTPDPDKYFDVNIKLRYIFSAYTPDFAPKSIDEFVLNFESVEKLTPDLIKISYEIKKRIRDEIGDWMRCNIGISTNRFLSKLAASLHKPDGLDVITYDNLIDVYRSVTLLDLNGINTRFQARLNSMGIYTPLDFLNADCELLQKQVFKSIMGRYWYERLRGWEVDDVEFETKSIGQQYALPRPTNEPKELYPMIMKLCEKMGRRLRRFSMVAHGIHVSLVYDDWTHWHRGRMMESEMYTTQELYTKAIYVLNQRPENKKVSKLSVSCYGLNDGKKSQMSLFDLNDSVTKKRKVSDAIDEVNDRYGEFVITPALMMGMESQIIKRVPFGNVKELEDLYSL